LNRVAVVSVDIHKRFSKAVVLGWDGQVMEESRVAHGNRHDMEAYFARFETGTDVVMEATFNWPWIAEAAEELDRKLVVIDELTAHINALDQEIRKGLKTDRKASLLMSLPGVGEKSAHAILAEVGEFDRFPNGRALASYAGLLPVPRESGGWEYERRTSPACNRFLRWALLETVTGAVRSSRRMRSLHARVRARNPKRTGKARVAVAREIAELAHLLVTRDVSYQEPGTVVNR
jgi:hypothetical protein